MDALRRANEVRLWRSAERERVANGDLARAVELLLEVDDRIATLPVEDFLRWLPGVGHYRARKIIERSFRWHTALSGQRSLDSLDLSTSTRLSIEIMRLKPRREFGTPHPSLRDRVLSATAGGVTVDR
jgi:hypothetical protein